MHHILHHSSRLQKFVLLGLLLAVFVIANSASAFYAEFGEVPTPTATATATSTPAATTPPGAVIVPPSGSTTPTPSPLATPVASVGVTPIETGLTGTPIVAALPTSMYPSFTPITIPTNPTLPLAGDEVSPQPSSMTWSSGLGRVSTIIALAAGIFTVGFTLLVAINLASSGVVLTHALGFALQSLWGVIGLKRRRRVWGTVYDAFTKRGIPYAKMELTDASGRVLETRYADHDGRYGFLVQPAGIQAQSMNVLIRSTMRGYLFPSKAVGSDLIDYVVYDHVYAGGLLAIGRDSFVNANVPMDPEKGAFRTNGMSWLPAGRIFAGFLDALFWIGLIAAPVAYWLQPTTVNLGILIVFVLVNAFRILSQFYRPFGVVRSHASGKPVAYALVVLNNKKGERVSFNVSDALGRYCIGAKAGTYIIRAVSPAHITPQQSSEQTLSSRTGWVTATLKL